MENNMSQYKWANNPLKLNRAIAEVGSEDENKLKAEYVRIGGKLNKMEEIKEEVKVEEVVVEEPKNEVVPEVVEESPKVESSEESVVPSEPSEVVSETVVSTDDVV